MSISWQYDAPAGWCLLVPSITNIGSFHNKHKYLCNIAPLFQCSLTTNLVLNQGNIQESASTRDTNKTIEPSKKLRSRNKASTLHQPNCLVCHGLNITVVRETGTSYTKWWLKNGANNNTNTFADVLLSPLHKEGTKQQTPHLGTRIDGRHEVQGDTPWYCEQCDRHNKTTDTPG